MHSHGGSGSKRQRSDEVAEQPDAGSLRIDAETKCRAGKGPAMAPLLPGASSLKKRRVGGVAQEGEAKSVAEEDEEDRISSLPEDLRLRILALLPLTSAIRTGALSTRWRALWVRRWPAPSSLDLHHLPMDDPDRLLASLERRGRRRLERFALTLHFGRQPHRYLGDKDIHRCLDYAAACKVEELHVDISYHWVSISSSLNFPPGFSSLVRLSLLRVGDVSFGYSLGSDAFPALEIIHIHSARSVDLDDLLSASPRLRTLDLRYCEFVDDLGAIYVSPVRRCHLRSLTVAECNRITKIHAGRACGLRSLHLSSALFPTYKIPSTALLEDLYICLRGHNYNPLKHWIKEFPNLTNLKVLTICSIALRLPTSSHDTVAGNSSEAVEEDKPAEVSEEDDPDEVLSKEDEPDEELSEEDETDGDLSEEDETDGDLSEEDETEEELLKEERVHEYMLEERPYYEDVYDEDPLDENVPQEEQSEEDVPEYGLNNLMIARMMKFKGQYHEMRLVSFFVEEGSCSQEIATSRSQGAHMLWSQNCCVSGKLHQMLG
ncbi:hypothetical protein HU200_059258 [Digitaria exilis]|uniref:F-box domain-containing protein n=1 Tax=Digitaria exilis TaxID=1010633 RepID=A0A835ACM9_9POAL|nr:hypothetical protein HU200_059258 [Digitaria exilis]